MIQIEGERGRSSSDRALKRCETDQKLLQMARSLFLLGRHKLAIEAYKQVQNMMIFKKENYTNISAQIYG